MKKRAIYTLLLLTLCAAAPAKDTIRTVRTTEAPEYFRIKDDTTVMVDFTLDIDKSGVKHQYQLRVTPIIVSGDTVHKKELKPVIVNGKTRAIAEERRKMSNREGQEAEAYAVYSVKHDSAVRYRMELPYEEWMEEASLRVKEEMTGCNCKEEGDGGTELMEEILYTPDYAIGDMQPCPVEYTIREERRDAFIIYEVDKYELRPEMYGNRAELQKIDEAMNAVRSNPAYEIKDIEITGYASPEAPSEYNTALAEKRAGALKEYVTDKYVIADTMLKVMPGAENWEGLVSFLRDFQIGHKDEIMRIIEDEEDLDRREERIKRVGGGVPYRMMLGVIYPNLRKNTFTVNYISKGRSVEEADSLVFSNPSELNPYEFYLVADSLYANDSTKYAEVLTIAADTYPDHATANTNAALLALKAGDEERAKKYLDRTGNEPSTWNIRGVMHARKGETKDALFWWQKGADAGDATCTGNIEELKKRIYNP